MRKESTPLAVTYSLLAAFCYALLAYLIKLAEAHLSNPMIIFFRQFFGLCILLPLIPFQLGSFKKLKTENFQLHLLRAFASLSSMFCLFYAIRYLPLVDAIILSYTRPLFIPIVVYFWFRKKWTLNTWLGLIMGFIGVVFILRPGAKIFDIAAFVGLAAGMFGGIAFTAIRRLTKTEPPERILFYYLALSLPLSSVPAATSWRMPPLIGWGLLLLIALGGTIYQMFLTRAYRHAKAFKVGSLLYSSVLFAWIFDYFLGKSEFNLVAILGMILIALGSFIALREQKIS